MNSPLNRRIAEGGNNRYGRLDRFLKKPRKNAGYAEDCVGSRIDGMMEHLKSAVHLSFAG